MTILPNKRNPNSNSKEGEINETTNNTSSQTRHNRTLLSSSQILIQETSQNRLSPVGSPLQNHAHTSYNEELVGSKFRPSHVGHLLGNSFPEEQSTSSQDKGQKRRGTAQARHTLSKRLQPEGAPSQGSGRQCRTYSRERVSKRKSREQLEHATASKTSVSPSITYPQNDDGEGCNSEDEYEPVRLQATSNEEWESRDRAFKELLRKKGLVVKSIVEDGACLFRAIADQIYGNEDMHSIVRNHCMDYIIQNRDFFSEYITEDINRYVSRKRNDFVHGNHLEIQALSEMYNRTIEVYCYSEEPINIFHGTHKYDYEPMRLSYQRGSHYNSIRDPYSASVGVGLGLPNFQPGEADHKLLKDATTASELTLIEQTMIQDKIAATDWEATNDAILEQATRESWAIYVNDGNVRDPLAGCSTSDVASSSSSTPRSPRASASASHSTTANLRLSLASSSHRGNRERLTAAFNTRIPTPPGRIPSPTSSGLRLTPDRRVPTPPASSLLRMPPGHRIPTPPRSCSSLPSSPHASPRLGQNLSMNSVCSSTRVHLSHSATSSPLSSPRLLQAKPRSEYPATTSRASSSTDNADESFAEIASDSSGEGGRTHETDAWEERTQIVPHDRQVPDTSDENMFTRMPPEMFGMSGWGEDADIIAKVLAESQREYLESLKAARVPTATSTSAEPDDVNTPGPSTQHR